MIKHLTSGLFAAAALAAAVLSSPSSQAQTYGQKVVAAVLMGEAWGEGEIGMIAVAEVIRTRADKSGISPMKVVLKPLQFSCLNGTTPNALIAKFESKPEWATALKVARRMYNQPETLPGITKGADHYVAGSLRPSWSKKMDLVATIGNHTFFRSR